MSITLIDADGTCRLVFEGRLTFEFARELEDGIIEALRRFTRFELDLSAVHEIDLCGLHLLQVLEAVAGDKVTTIAGSSLVEHTRTRLLASQRGTWLRGSRGERERCERQALAA